MGVEPTMRFEDLRAYKARPFGHYGNHSVFGQRIENRTQDACSRNMGDTTSLFSVNLVVVSGVEPDLSSNLLRVVYKATCAPYTTRPNFSKNNLSWSHLRESDPSFSLTKTV